MGILKKLSRLFMPSVRSEERARFVTVQCHRCGEQITARVDLFNDLSPIYSEKGLTYFCRKVIMGSGRCFQKIEVEMTFDENRKMTQQEIHGGAIVE